MAFGRVRLRSAVVGAAIASLSGCGSRVIAEPSEITPTPADAGPEVDAPPDPFAPSRIAELAAPCKGARNAIALRGYATATTLPDGGWDVGARAQYIRVTGGVTKDPFVELEFSSDMLGAPLEAKRYTDATYFSAATPGRPTLEVTYGSYACSGEGWFQILELTWSDVGSRLVSFTAVFEQTCNPYSDEDTRVSGCVHFEGR